MNENTTAKLHLLQDQRLVNILNQVSLADLDRPMSCFDALIDAIISQQLSNKAAATIYNRFLNLVGEEDVMSFLMATDIPPLRSVGLSNQKASYVKNTAQFFDHHQLTDTIFQTMTDEDIISLLTQIKGVGTWTVEMVLIFKLNRPDILPVDDLIVRQGLKKVLGVPDMSRQKENEIFLKETDSWRPFRSYAARYLWAAKDLL
ncbi:MAG: DNA-3-methyladenine glycosylase 2 family protein [Saprospiraceae bacterium]